MEAGFTALIAIAAALIGGAIAFFAARAAGKNGGVASGAAVSGAAGESQYIELARLQEREKHLNEEAARLRAELQEAAQERASQQKDLAARERDLAAAAERESGLNRTIRERDEQLKGLQQELKSEFENIATNVLKAATTQLSEKSQESLSTILHPLQQRIFEFQQKVETTHIEDTAQRSALTQEIKRVAETNQGVGLQADALTKALKGDSQLRGRWGEIRLERILENSGLERGREFVIQGGDFNIKNEEGSSQRPDVIILLPEGRHFVIDSKLSLVDYLEYEAADTEEERSTALKKLLRSCRAHVDNLAGKNYQHAAALNSHDLIFMFMPIEGSAALVQRHDQSLFDYAWSRKIVMVSPSTLFSTMRTVNSIWRYERQSRNAQTIAQQAGQLYDKLAGFIEDLNDVSRKLHAAAASHNEAMKKLSSGQGNALSRAQRLKSLGVASKKNFPAVLVEGEAHAVLEEDSDTGAQADADSSPPPD